MLPSIRSPAGSPVLPRHVTRRCHSALTSRFIKIGHLNVNRVLDVHDDYRAISSARLNMLFPRVPKPARPHVEIGVDMIKHPTDGLLFFDGGRELRIVAYDVSRADAVVHADGLDLLPINFYNHVRRLSHSRKMSARVEVSGRYWCRL